jgi:hypothetical protein
MLVRKTLMFFLLLPLMLGISLLAAAQQEKRLRPRPEPNQGICTGSGEVQGRRGLLVDRGGGLVYDTWLDVTWLRDANMSKTMGLSKDGLMTAAEAMKWAADLVYQGYTDWRLPDARNLYKSEPRPGWRIRTSELGHLFYDKLGNSATMKVDDRRGLKNSSPFVNVQPFRYWCSTKYQMSSDLWWYFDMGSGYQWDAFASATGYAWAVRDGDSRPLNLNRGDIPPIPQPPPYTMDSSPELVAIPNTEITALRDSKVDIFSYRGYWWRSFQERWYRSTGYNGPWYYVRPEMTCPCPCQQAGVTRVHIRKMAKRMGHPPTRHSLRRTGRAERNCL